jgi:hypothetical protein
MLRLTGEQSTGRRAIKASNSFAAFAPHWYCKLSSAPAKPTAFRRTNSPSPCKLSINAVDECVQPIVYFFLMLVVDR